MEKEISSRDVFDIWEKEFPPTPESPKKEETLFTIEEEAPTEPEQAPVVQSTPQIELPKGFEEDIVNKITNAILEKLKPQEGNE